MILKVAEPLGNHDVMFKIDNSNAIRLLARTVTKWYEIDMGELNVIIDLGTF